jgi:hypothetical protein
VDPFFLFQGTLHTAAPRAVSLFTAAESEALSSVPTGPTTPDQPLTLYIAYDQPTPAQKRRRLDAAPFRYSLRSEADDSLLGCTNGLAAEILVDEGLKMAVWGSDLVLAFPAEDDLLTFSGALRGVATRHMSLDGHPAAAILKEMRRSAAPGPLMSGAAMATPAVSVTASGSLNGVGDNAPLQRGELDATSDADSPPPQASAP